jgi:hypothetical protein
MIRSKLGLLGLCAVVFGMMAFAASAAQAESTAQWLILNSSGQLKTGGELKSQLVAKIENEDGTLLTKVIGLSVKVLCKSATLEGVFLEKEGSLTNGGKVDFGGCETFVNNVLEPVCTPRSPGGAFGLIRTNALKGLAVLVAGDKRIRVQPSVAGGSFVSIEFGEECVLPIAPIFGELYFKD